MANYNVSRSANTRVHSLMFVFIMFLKFIAPCSSRSPARLTSESSVRKKLKLETQIEDALKCDRLRSRKMRRACFCDKRETRVPIARL
jgi:hypothetical protein